MRLFFPPAVQRSTAFPDVLATLPDVVTLDGELLVIRDGEVAPFNDLQQRLNRISPNSKTLLAYPAAVRLYDLLREGQEDLRGLPFVERRQRLERQIRLSRLRPCQLQQLVRSRNDSPTGNGLAPL